MNIFASSYNPKEAAYSLDDKRAIKMILESTQLLSNAIYLHGGKAPYKPTHIKHPCTIWTSLNQSNYLWLLAHAYALCRIYTKTYGKIHKCEYVLNYLFSRIPLLPKGKLTIFADCTGITTTGFVVEHYKTCLRGKWEADIISHRPPTWLTRSPPSWFVN